MTEIDHYHTKKKCIPQSDWCSLSKTTSVAAVAPSLARPGTSGQGPPAPSGPGGNAITHRPREATAVGPTETTTASACQNFTIGAHAILAHQDILGGWRVGLSNSSPVLNSEDEQGRAPD